MPKKAKSPSVDPLQRTHEIMKTKLDSYREVREVFQYISMRNKRNEFLTDEAVHTKVVEKIFLHIAATSKACKKDAGLEILELIKTALMDHAKDSRKVGCFSLVQHRFHNIKEKDDLHPASLYKRKIKQQKFLMQTIAADFEAMALVAFLERKQYKTGKILKSDRLPFTHNIFKLTSDAENALDDLRAILLLG